MTLVPQLDNERINSLLSRLDVLAKQTVIDELEFKRIEKEAYELTDIQSLKSAGYVALGILSSLRLDTNGVKKWFEAAMFTSPQEYIPHVQDNHILSLQRTYSLPEAADLAMHVHEQNRDNLAALDRAISTAASIMRISNLLELLERSYKLNHDPFSGPDYVKNGNDSQEPSLMLLKTLNLAESEVSDRVDAAAKLLLSKNIYHRGSLMSNLKTGEMSYQFIVNATPTQAAELSFDIAEALIDKFDDPLSHVLTISCVPDEHISRQPS